MAAIEFNWKPTDRQLRQFGFVALFALPLIAYLLTGRPNASTWQSWHSGAIGGATAVGVVLSGLAWLRPRAIRPVFITACLLAFPIGLVISEVILLALFLLVFAPVAILFRIVGRDALHREINRDQTSYWQAKPAASSIRSYFRQS